MNSSDIFNPVKSTAPVADLTPFFETQVRGRDVYLSMEAESRQWRRSGIVGASRRMCPAGAGGAADGRGDVIIGLM